MSPCNRAEPGVWQKLQLLEQFSHEMQSSSAQVNFQWGLRVHFHPEQNSFWCKKSAIGEIRVFGKISSGEQSEFRQISSLAHEIRFPNCPISVRLLKMNIHRMRKLSRASLLFGELWVDWRRQLSLHHGQQRRSLSHLPSEATHEVWTRCWLRSHSNTWRYITIILWGCFTWTQNPNSFKTLLSALIIWFFKFTYSWSNIRGTGFFFSLRCLRRWNTLITSRMRLGASSILDARWTQAMETCSMECFTKDLV